MLMRTKSVSVVFSVGGTADTVRVTAQAYEVWNTLAPQLNTELIRLKKQIALLLPRVNATLKAAGKGPIVPSTDELGQAPRQGPQATFIP